MKKIDAIKGIHPGLVLERELKLRKLPKGKFAASIGEYPQTLVAIMKGRRKMNTALALKLEQALGFDEGYFMVLQVFYDITAEKAKQKINIPNLKKIRPVLFWDTRIDKIDWEKQKAAVIKRVFERGNPIEKKEITRFYGKAKIDSVLKKTSKAD